MRTFKAEETRNGHSRIYSFYSKRERDEFVAVDPEHRKNFLFVNPDKYSKYKSVFKTRNGRVGFCFDKDNICHGGY